MPPRPVILEEHWLHKGRVVLKFAGIDSISDAEALRGLDVAIPRAQRAPLEEDAVYIDDLIGCHIIDVSGGTTRDLGPIISVDRDITVNARVSRFWYRRPVKRTIETLPGLAPVAMQQGRYAARAVLARITGSQPPPFHYKDKGNLATIGRARAVADIKGVHLSGPIAWVTWLAVHLFYLIGFQNRVLVLTRWAFSFVAHGRGARLITDGNGASPQSPEE
jgi:hypothetical protein